MFGKFMGVAGRFVAGMAVAVVFDEDGKGNSLHKKNDDNRQLSGLSDGNGGVYVNGEHLTQQEAEDMQLRGELYDTYY
ncbi:hypothetical protein G3489_19275 [Shewanella baltica]|uniref:hypothetical protein n=1 Tax=Shewanella baltica TaxID=62322 RepID=UPI00217DCC22|nr:hypothetical protein [Shewanella baltica]MCS6271818.1 hypothetical protein [Shewanella baltica]